MQANILMPALVAVGLAAAGTVSSIAPAGAAESDFLERFEGRFSGSGLVQRKPEEKPQQVKCDMQSTNTGNRVTIGGSCRAYLIFSREIGADIQYDPGSDRYTGTFTGSVIGPARLSGKRNGDAVVMTITWPKEVNGDTKANMRIENAGNGNLSIIVSDDLPGSGNVVTTDLSLSK